MLKKVKIYLVIGLVGSFIFLSFINDSNDVEKESNKVGTDKTLSEQGYNESSDGSEDVTLIESQTPNTSESESSNSVVSQTSNDTGKDNSSSTGNNATNSVVSQTSNNIEDEPSKINGKMVYHSFSNYSDRNSQIYLFDFKTKENICLSSKFKDVFNAMNPDFNADGNKIVFMGMVNNSNSSESEWDVFTYNLKTEELINITKGNGLRDEDPKFSPDGKKVIFKQGHFSQELNKMIYDIREIDLDTKNLKVVTNDVDEDSMPIYSSDGKSIYYSRVTDSKNPKIYKVNLENTNDITEVYEESGVDCYYPTIYGDKLYFSKNYSSSIKSDVIVQMDLNTKKISIPNFNSQDFDCSDAAVISDRLIIVSSTMPSGKGAYDLYIADIVTGQTWSMNLFNDGINDSNNQLGASYHVEVAN